MPGQKTQTKSKQLTEKQKRFCEEYLIDLNATQAAIRAGYSEETARFIGSENLTKPNIQQYIKSKQQKIAGELDISQERVLKEYASIAFSDIGNLYNDNGTFVKISELSKDARSAIASIESDELTVEGVSIGVKRKVKMYDKLRALDGICKILGYNAPDKMEGTMNINWQETKNYGANHKANGGS